MMAQTTADDGRIAALNAHGMKEVCEDALQEYTVYGTDMRRPPAVVGLAIVGSSLSDEFEEGESDLDYYVVVEDDSFAGDDGFWRLLNDTTSDWGVALNNMLPEIFTEADCNGVIAEENVESEMYGDYEMVATEEVEA